MAYRKVHRQGDNPAEARLLYQIQSPDIAKTLADLHVRFSKYAMSDEKLQRLVAKAMGKRTLTEELYAMRDMLKKLRGQAP